jgi:uncharacterized protein YjbJ (UPF0337 family)
VHGEEEAGRIGGRVRSRRTLGSSELRKDDGAIPRDRAPTRAGTTFALDGRNPISRRCIMSNESKKAEGVAEQVGGKIKAGIGKIIGNERMEAEGHAKELKGEAREEAARAAERAKGKTEEVVGAIKNRVGAAIDNEKLQAEGKAKELKGEARQAGNPPRH